MAFARHRFGSVKRLSKTAGAVAALVMGATLLAAPQAVADSSPSPADLLKACNWADYCQFHPQSWNTYRGTPHQVGSRLYNCTHNTADKQIGWDDTILAGDSVGISLTVGAKFEDAFEESITQTYTQYWERSHTDRDNTTVHIQPNWFGWVQKGDTMQAATGWYEIHFGKRYYGHYIWYVNNYRGTAYYKADYVVGRDHPMSGAQRRAYCKA